MKTNSLSGEQATYDLIKKGLDATSLRGKAISNNITNIHTKDYKRQYVTFEENLKTAMDDTELKVTDEKHIKINGEYGEAKVHVDNATSMRTDGNNVDIDNEVVNLAANTLMYNAMITKLNSKISTTRYVVNGR